MAQPLSAACTGTSSPGASAWPAGLMVMALRAAEQHVLVVLGEADLLTAPQLRTELIDMLAEHPPSVLVELGALEFCDLAGLDALHDAARAAQDAGVALTFRGMSAQLSWLHHTFPPRPPIPPPPTQGKAQPVPDTSAAATRFTREYLTGRGGGRRRAADGLVHAVPASDTTRSAVCGARTWLATTPWTGAAPDSCPDCAAAVAESFAVSTVHPFPAPRPAPGMHLQPQHQPLIRRVS